MIDLTKFYCYINNHAEEAKNYPILTPKGRKAAKVVGIATLAATAGFGVGKLV